MQKLRQILLLADPSFDQRGNPSFSRCTKRNGQYKHKHSFHTNTHTCLPQVWFRHPKTVNSCHSWNSHHFWCTSVSHKLLHTFTFTGRHLKTAMWQMLVCKYVHCTNVLARELELGTAPCQTTLKNAHVLKCPVLSLEIWMEGTRPTWGHTMLVQFCILKPLKSKV